MGNRPLQGMKALVRMATSRSRGLSMMRQPVTPQALHPRVLQQGEQREEDGHGRQHHRNHPGRRAVYPVHQRFPQPPRRAAQQGSQRLLRRHEPPAQQLRGPVGAPDGEPQHRTQQQQHHRHAAPAGEHAVQPPVTGVDLLGAAGEAGISDGRCPAGHGGAVVSVQWRPCVLPRRPPRHVQHRRAQIVHPLPAPCRRRHHRCVQPAGQGVHVHGDALAAGLVHQIHAHHQPRRAAAQLHRQMQISPEAGGVRHQHGDIGTAAADEVPGDLLLRRVCPQGVGPRQVDEPEGRALPRVGALRYRHRFPGPVACVLAHARQGVEHRGFSHVGVARQRRCVLLH